MIMQQKDKEFLGVWSRVDTSLSKAILTQTLETFLRNATN